MKKKYVLIIVVCLCLLVVAVAAVPPRTPELPPRPVVKAVSYSDPKVYSVEYCTRNNYVVAGCGHNVSISVINPPIERGELPAAVVKPHRAKVYGWLFPLAISVVVASGGGSLYLTWRFKLIQFVYGLYMPESAKEERRIAKLRRRTEKEELKRVRDIKAVSKQLRPKVIMALARSGFTWIYERQGATVKAAKPQIKHVMYSKEAIYYRLDRLPFRTNFTDLINPDVEKNLGLTIGRECRIIEGIDIGVWIQVGLVGGLSAIPPFFPWYSDETETNAIEMLPKSKNWSVAIGAGENRKFIYEDVRDFPHLLVAGATDGGKSVFLNQMLCTLLSRNTPKMLEVVLIDLKGGLEFAPYANVPHLRREPVIDAQGVPSALAEIRKEKEHRFKLCREAGVRNIREYNHTHRKKLPYIFVFFDEIANLMLFKDLKPHVENLLGDVAAQGRAMGIHLVLCTQVPTKDVITRIVLSNITTRVALATDAQGSMLILGNWEAKELPPKTGRAVYVRGAFQTMVQLPFISTNQVDKKVRELTGAPEPEEPDHIIVMRKSIERIKGVFNQEAMKDIGVHVDRLRRVKDVFTFDYATQEPVVLIDGNEYILSPLPNGKAGRNPYYVIPVNDGLPSDLLEAEQFYLDCTGVATRVSK